MKGKIVNIIFRVCVGIVSILILWFVFERLGISGLPSQVPMFMVVIWTMYYIFVEIFSKNEN